MDQETVKEQEARINKLEEVIDGLRRVNEGTVKDCLAKYRRLIDATSEGFMELDLNHRIIDYNTAIISLTGISGENLLHRHVETLYNKQSVFIHFASKDHLNFEAKCITDIDPPPPLLFKRSLLRDGNGEPNGYLIFITNLSELKEVQQNLQQAETRYRDMYKNAAQGMYQCTLDGRFIRSNPAMAKTFGFQGATALLFNPGGMTNLYRDPASRQTLLLKLQKYKVITNYEVEMQTRDGKPVWAMINARLTKDTAGRTLIEGILIDNTQKRLAEDKLRRSRERFRHLAEHDSLTGLYNTRYLYTTLDKLISASDKGEKSFTLVFLDMDNFKFVVDTYGHLNGSQALKEVAGTLKTCLQEPSFGVAYGGDEFVLVLPRTAKEAALEQVRRIRHLMKNTLYLKNQGLGINLSASFGVATYPDDAGSRRELLALADEAMFHVKSIGKDAVGVTQKQQEQK